MLEVKVFQPSMLDDVVAAYNRLTARAPYCYPLTPEVFAEAVTGESAFDPAGFFVAYDEGRAVGFIHAGIPKEAASGHGGILIFLGEERLACRKLLVEAIGFLKQAGVNVCHVTGHESGNREFYSGVHMGCDVAHWQGYFMPANALRWQNFEIEREGFVMSRNLGPDMAAQSPKIDASLRVECLGDAGSFYTTGKVKARVEEEDIGSCTFYFMKRLSQHLGKGIGQIAIAVDERFQRKGVGSALLSRAHQELYKAGARKVVLATNYALYPAIRMYEKLGYRKELVNMTKYTGYFSSE